MFKKYTLFFLIMWLIIQPESLYASLSTRVRITAIKGIVTTQLVRSENDAKTYCPLERKLDITESRVIDGRVRIKTGDDSYAQIEYTDGSIIKLAPNTDVILQRDNIFVNSGDSWFKVEKQKDGKLIIKTPTAIAGIRGTEFSIDVTSDGTTTCRLFEGTIEISDSRNLSKRILTPGREVTIKKSSSTLAPTFSNINGNDKWWTNWPTLVPISEKPSNGNINPGGSKGNVRYPVADDYVYAYSYSGWNKANWGKHTALAAGWHPTGGEQRTYIKFDLSGINTKISKAVLRLYYNHLGGSNVVDLGVFKVNSPWEEGRGTYPSSSPALYGELSWVNQPSFDNYPMVTFNPGKKVPNWINIDITSLVKSWLNGSPNYGMVIKPTGNFVGKSPAQYGFMSREYRESDKRPQLILSGSSQRVNTGFSNAVSDPCGSDVAFVRSLAQSILDHDAEISYTPNHGIAHLRDLQNGVPRWRIIWNFFNSPEYLHKNKSHSEFIRDVYQSVLAREPSANEIKDWPKVNRNDILRKFFNSDEYLNLMRNCKNGHQKTKIISINGPWTIHQSNGYSGNMNIQFSSNGHLSGNIVFNGNIKGTIDGQLSGNTLSFTVDFHDGHFGNYNGTLTPGGKRIVNGTAKDNRGVSASWTATKAALNQITGKWKWFTNVIVTIYPDGTVKGSNGGKGMWSQYIKNTQQVEYVINWSGGQYIDRLTLNNNTLSGKNQNGTDVWATRINPAITNYQNHFDNVKPWVLGMDSRVYVGTKSGWAENPGNGLGKDIAIDKNGRPWVIGSDNTIWHFNGAGWVEYPGNIRGIAISVSPDGTPWILGTNYRVYHGTGTGWIENPGNGLGKDIAIDRNGRPWVIGSDNTIWYFNGARWVEYPGNMRGIAISISPQGIPWIIGTNNRIYHGTGTGWIENPGNGLGKDIAIDANGRPWIIGIENSILYYSGNNLVQFPGRGKGHRIAVGQ